MLLTSVIIVLREVLEASVLIALLMVVSDSLKQDKRWVITSLLAGSVLSIIYAQYLSDISLWFEYSGQEVATASMQIIMVILIFIILYWQNSIRAQDEWEKHKGEGNIFLRRIILLMAAVVVLAIVREGSEITIYISNYISSAKQPLLIISGSLIGCGIGLSLGVIMYYSLTFISSNRRYSLLLAHSFLILISAGLLAQAVQFLIQAGWLISAQAWDSSEWLAEDSLFGQMLYAVMGYESTPTVLEVVAYFGVLTAGIFLSTQRWLILKTFNHK